MISFVRRRLSSCSSSSSIGFTKHVAHVDMIKGNTRLKELILAGNLSDALSLFDKMSHRDEISWTTLISGYVGAMKISEALALFSKMWVQPGLRMDPFVLSLALKACVLDVNVNLGESLHGYAVKTGFLNSPYVGSALLDMYTKIGTVELGRRVFDEMPLKSVISWTAIINGLVCAGHYMEAVSCFSEMCMSAVQCNEHTIAIVLKACADLGALGCGREIHSHTIKKGFDSNSFVANTLAKMYCKCGKLDHALHLLERVPTQDVVSWTTLIATYIQMGLEESAILAFLRMQEAAVAPDEYTYGVVISGCVNLARTGWGQQMHAFVLCKGFLGSLPVANSLMSMYSKCGQLTSAVAIFCEIGRKDVISWNTIIVAYAIEGYGDEAFELLSSMRREGLETTESSLATVISVCGNMVLVKQGMQLHAHALSIGLEQTTTMQSSLINMYAKCGIINAARKIFDMARNDNVVSWTAMINGYAEHGCSHEAIDLFEKLSSVGLQPDSVTYISIINACSHAGLIDLGFHYFNTMMEQQITPSKEHYGCIVDMLCRAGRLDEAEYIIESMPFEADDIVWSTLLRACKIHGDIKRGRQTAEHILKLDSNCAVTHISLANVYSAKGLWRDAAEIRKIMKSKGVMKEPGWSWIIVKDRVSTFVAGDQSHLQDNEMYHILSLLSSRETSLKDVALLLGHIED